MCYDIHGQFMGCFSTEFCPDRGGPPMCTTCAGYVQRCAECFAGTCPTLLVNLENLWPVEDPAYFGNGPERDTCSCDVPQVCDLCERGQCWSDQTHRPTSYTRG